MASKVYSDSRIREVHLTFLFILNSPIPNSQFPKTQNLVPHLLGEPLYIKPQVLPLQNARQGERDYKNGEVAFSTLDSQENF